MAWPSGTSVMHPRSVRGSVHVLVTGGAGFIGSHVVESLPGPVTVLDDLSRGHRDHVPPKAHLVEGDVADAAVVDQAMEDIDSIVHLAAKTSVPESFADPAGYARVNVGGTWNVLEAARAHRVPVVLASSAAVYGVPVAAIQREVDVPRPLDPYGLTKLANEQQARVASHAGPATTCLRFFNVYGPRQDPEGPYASVVPRFLDLALRDRPLTIHGDGTQRRDFVHVDDVVQAVHLALRREEGHLVCNIGSGTATRVLDVASAVQGLCPGTALRHEAPRAGDVPSSVADIARAKEVLGYAPQVPFEKGLRRTHAAFQACR